MVILNEAILIDLNTKFNNRHKAELKMLTRLKAEHDKMEVRHNEDYLAGRTTAIWEVVYESPRRVCYSKSNKGTKGKGRPRKCESQWSEGNVITVLGKRGVVSNDLLAGELAIGNHVIKCDFICCVWNWRVCSASYEAS
jgi:hypothetical protein